MDYYDGYEDEFTDAEYEEWERRPETIEGKARGQRVAGLLITQRMQAIRAAVETMECRVCGEPLTWWLSDDDREWLFAALDLDLDGTGCYEENNPTWTAVTPYVQRAVAMISEGAKYVEPDDEEKDTVVRWTPPPCGPGAPGFPEPGAGGPKATPDAASKWLADRSLAPEASGLEIGS